MPDSLRTTATSAVVAVAAGVAAVAGSYAVAGLTPAFVAAPVSEFVVAATPDAVVTWSIQTLGDLGSELSFLLALSVTAGLFAVAAAAGVALARRFAVPPSPVVGLLGVAVALSLTGAVGSTLAAGAGAGFVVALANLPSVAAVRAGAGEEDGSDESASSASAARRRVLRAVAGAVGIGGAGAFLGARQTTEVPATAGDAVGDDAGDESAVDGSVESLLGRAADNSLSVSGIEPLVSENFYQVDINGVNPVVDPEEWSLRVTGAVEEEAEFGLDDLRELTESVEHRFVTLRCVGESLNGKKMDTALWTGVPVMDLLDSAGIDAGDNCCVMLRAADDYFEEFPLSALRDGFLAFEMNGETLPRAHGYPVRALIPGHWGEINVKWLTEIEVLEEEAKGYWEKRGWHGTGPVNTVAKLHAVNRLGEADSGGTRMQVGGHAYAGTRGIRQVEVSTDGGQSWNEATLSEPLPGEDVWRQWEYRYEADAAHEVVVRATDGEGNLQPEEQSKPFPSGPTGWVSKRVEP